MLLSFSEICLKKDVTFADPKWWRKLIVMVTSVMIAIILPVNATSMFHSVIPSQNFLSKLATTC
jgi:hypothetical protein